MYVALVAIAPLVILVAILAVASRARIPVLNAPRPSDPPPPTGLRRFGLAVATLLAALVTGAFAAYHLTWILQQAIWPGEEMEHGLAYRLLGVVVITALLVAPVGWASVRLLAGLARLLRPARASC